MIECKCCAERFEERADCPVCGFSVFVDVGEEDSEFQNRMVKKFIENKLGGIDIGFIAYDYEISGGVIGEPVEEFTKICSASEYNVGKTLMLYKNFEPVVSDRDFEVKLLFAKGNNIISDSIVKISPGREVSHKNIGIVFDKGLNIRLVVGENDQKVYSQSIKLEVNF